MHALNQLFYLLYHFFIMFHATRTWIEGELYYYIDSLFCLLFKKREICSAWLSNNLFTSHAVDMSFCHFSGCDPLAPGWYSVGSHLGYGPLAPDWYSVGSHLYYILFCHFSGCGPLAPGWYSVGSHLNSIC
jgi:hypothetical protein